jgi:hypothetical protein
MYWAVIFNGACIAKVVWDEERPYSYPHPHDEMIYDPDNEIAVEEYQDE